MIHVLEAISDTNIGGAGRLLLARLSCTDRNRIRTTVLLPKESMLKKPLQTLKIRVVEVPFGADTSFEWWAVFSLANIIRKMNPDLVHTHGWFSVRVAAWMIGVPISIYTRHCAFDLSDKEKKFFTKIRNYCLCELLSDCVIAVSPAAKDNLIALGIRPSRIHVIFNGCLPVLTLSKSKKVDLRRQMGIPEDAIVVGILARLEPYKDHSCFLRAAKRLLEESKGKSYYFLIVGTGSLEQKLKNQSKSLGIASHVFFTGFLSDPSDVMNLFDINVNCSVGTETASLALSEGMSLGIPAICSDFGGNPYMIKDGENGFIYRRGDDNQLADCIRRIATDSCLAEKMSKKATERFEKDLNAFAMTKQYEELYCRLCKKKLFLNQYRGLPFEKKYGKIKKNTL